MPESWQSNWVLQSMMDMQKTQGQLIEASQSLREGQREMHSRQDAMEARLSRVEGRLDAVELRLDALTREVAGLSQQVTALTQRVDALARRMDRAQIIMSVVGAGLVGTVGFLGWVITNAIAVLPTVLNAN